MGPNTLRLALVALLALSAAAVIPLGALHAARRSRRKQGARPTLRGLGGAGVLGLLLHLEHLSSIAVETDAAPLREAYEPSRALVRLSPETARARTVHATATAAYLAALVTLHADRDRDFERAHRREFTLALAANLLPPVLLCGLLIPGEGRALLTVLAPILLATCAGCALLMLPLAGHAARRALTLLDRHGLSGDKAEREALRAALAARAALCLATPLTRCVWLRFAL